MNKKVIAITAAVVVIGGALAIYFVTLKPGQNALSPGAINTTTLPTASVKASDILTSDVAKSILGDNIDNPAGSTATVSTNGINESTSIYTTKIDPSAKDVTKGSGLQVYARIATTQDGADTNKQAFNSQPSGTQAVSGIGDKAFYNPSFNQLNVLKGGDWYIVTYYKDVITNSTLDSDKELALKLQFK